jgi:hypothetical protein
MGIGKPFRRNNRLPSPAPALAVTLAVLALSPAAAPRPQSPPFSARVVLGPVKIRPYALLPPSADRPVTCAQNSYCSLQIVVSDNGEDLEGVDVSLSNFIGPAGVSLSVSEPSSAAVVYREDFLNVFYRSSEQGDIGEWPDPLLPKTDLEYGESRNGFPFDVHRVSPAYKRYLAEKGRSIPQGRGKGAATTGGDYAGGFVRRYVIEIVRPGRVGVATFRWWSDPGSAQPSTERITSQAMTELDSGVTVAFRGDGGSDDFLAGDEFWIFAGPQRHQPVWVDILIPENQSPGIYSGEVRVTARNRSPLRLPVRLEVLDFALPVTTALPNTFLMNWAALAAAHFPSLLTDPRVDEARKIQLGHVYASAALRNGITVTPSEDLAPVYTFNPDGGLAQADYRRYDEAVSGFMDGGASPNGARWTSLPLPRLKRLSDAQRATALRDFVSHARARGWYDRLFDYTYDEPSTLEDFAQLKSRARLVRGVDPAIPRLVTTNLNPDLIGLVTRWCPVVNALESKYGSPREHWTKPNHASREVYDSRLKLGESLWWYQSCSSHGCGGSGQSPQFDNWPSYMIDASAVANRVFGFLTAVTYRISGILYWDVAYAHSQAGAPDRPGINPWESQYYFGGNGDGSLFYPGTPGRVGGTHDIPVESLRLKMIRESLYDAEYALVLRQLGEGNFLEKEVGSMVEKAWRWNADPEAWLELRSKLGSKILRRTAPRPLRAPIT